MDSDSRKARPSQVLSNKRTGRLTTPLLSRSVVSYTTYPRQVSSIISSSLGDHKRGYHIACIRHINYKSTPTCKPLANAKYDLSLTPQCEPDFPDRSSTALASVLTSIGDGTQVLRAAFALRRQSEAILSRRTTVQHPCSSFPLRKGQDSGCGVGSMGSAKYDGCTFAQERINKVTMGEV